MPLEFKKKKRESINFLAIFCSFSTPLSFLCQGMVYSAEYIKKKLETEMILSQAFGRDLVRDSTRRVPSPWSVGGVHVSDVLCLFLWQNKGTMHYGLVIVGHSLGAGTAAILSFLLRPQYPTLHCYSYSPPGGLLR